MAVHLCINEVSMFSRFRSVHRHHNVNDTVSALDEKKTSPRHLTLVDSLLYRPILNNVGFRSSACVVQYCIGYNRSCFTPTLNCKLGTCVTLATALFN